MKVIKVQGKRGVIGQITHGPAAVEGWYCVETNGHGSPHLTGFYREKPTVEWFEEMAASLRETAALYGR